MAGRVTCDAPLDEDDLLAVARQHGSEGGAGSASAHDHHVSIVLLLHAGRGASSGCHARRCGARRHADGNLRVRSGSGSAGTSTSARRRRSGGSSGCAGHRLGSVNGLRNRGHGSGCCSRVGLALQRRASRRHERVNVLVHEGDTEESEKVQQARCCGHGAQRGQRRGQEDGEREVPPMSHPCRSQLRHSSSKYRDGDHIRNAEPFPVNARRPIGRLHWRKDTSWAAP